MSNSGSGNFLTTASADLSSGLNLAIDGLILGGAGFLLYEVIKCKSSGSGSLLTCLVGDVASTVANTVKDTAIGAADTVKNTADDLQCSTIGGGIRVAYLFQPWRLISDPNPMLQCAGDKDYNIDPGARKAGIESQTDPVNCVLSGGNWNRLTRKCDYDAQKLQIEYQQNWQTCKEEAKGTPELVSGLVKCNSPLYPEKWITAEKRDYNNTKVALECESKGGLFSRGVCWDAGDIAWRKKIYTVVGCVLNQKVPNNALWNSAGAVFAGYAFISDYMTGNLYLKNGQPNVVNPHRFDGWAKSGLIKGNLEAWAEAIHAWCPAMAKISNRSELDLRKTMEALKLFNFSNTTNDQQQQWCDNLLYWYQRYDAFETDRSKTGWTPDGTVFPLAVEFALSRYDNADFKAWLRSVVEKNCGEILFLH